MENKNDIWDEKEYLRMEYLKVKYLKLINPSYFSKKITPIFDQVKKTVPQSGWIKIGNTITQSDFMSRAMSIVGKQFKEIETKTAIISVSKKDVLNVHNRYHSSIVKFEDICFARSYDVSKMINKKDYEHLIWTTIQSVLSGITGISGVVYSTVFGSFIYFRAAQSIALYYGYDVKDDPLELEFAGEVTLIALSKIFEDKKSNHVANHIHQMMLTDEHSLKVETNKSTFSSVGQASRSASSAKLVTKRAVNMSEYLLKKSLSKSHKKATEQEVFSELFERLIGLASKSSGKKVVPIAGTLIGMIFDISDMTRLLKYTNMVYEKRFIIEKEMRINNTLDTINVED